MDCSPVKYYSSFHKIFASRSMDVYSASERRDGTTCTNASQSASIDATVTVYRDSNNPRNIVGIDLSEGDRVLESIIGMERVPGSPAPGVHDVQVYNGHIDENHNNQVDEGEKEVTIVTYPVSYGQDPANSDSDLQPLESIKILEEFEIGNN